MRRGAFFLAVILVITLPDYSAILTVGMPDLGTVPLSALSAAYLAGEKVDTAVRAPTLLSALQFLLNQFKHLRLNDGLVISLHIVLRDFALVDLFLLGEEIIRIALLQERIWPLYFSLVRMLRTAPRSICLCRPAT